MKKKFNVEGMTCSACSAHVDKAVRKLNGVNNCNVNLLSNTMEVEFDDNVLKTDDIIESVKKAGYKAYINKEKISKKKDFALIKLIICFSLLAVLMYITMGHMIGLKLPSFLNGTLNAVKYALAQLILVIPILIIYNHFFVSGYKKLFKLAPNMDSLIAVGATASITTSSSLIKTLAVFGARPINLVIALVVFFFDILSKYLPKLTNVKIIPADSKYKLCRYSSTN